MGSQRVSHNWNDLAAAAAARLWLSTNKRLPMSSHSGDHCRANHCIALPPTCSTAGKMLSWDRLRFVRHWPGGKGKELLTGRPAHSVRLAGILNLGLRSGHPLTSLERCQHLLSLAGSEFTSGSQNEWTARGSPKWALYCLESQLSICFGKSSPLSSLLLKSRPG